MRYTRRQAQTSAYMLAHASIYKHTSRANISIRMHARQAFCKKRSRSDPFARSLSEPFARRLGDPLPVPGGRVGGKIPFHDSKVGFSVPPRSRTQTQESPNLHDTSWRKAPASTLDGDFRMVWDFMRTKSGSEGASGAGKAIGWHGTGQEGRWSPRPLSLR